MGSNIKPRLTNYYLVNYFKNNNLLNNYINIDKKIISRLLGFIICALIALLMDALNIHNRLSGEISSVNTLQYIQVVFIACYVVAIISLIVLLIRYIAPVWFLMTFKRVKYRTKEKIFNVLDYTLILPICAIIATFIFGCICTVATVDGDSMLPTLVNTKQVLIVYHKEVKQSSIVVCHIMNDDNYILNNEDYESYYVKRVIGLPGDSISWNTTNGLTINGEEVEENYLDNKYTYNAIGISNVFYYENGTKHYVEKINNEYIIPTGYYFVMGDNRGNSTDSRMIGLIKEEDIVGVVTRHMNFLLPGGKIK